MQDTINVPDWCRISPDLTGLSYHKKRRKSVVFWTFPDYAGRTNGAQKRTRTSTPLRAPAPEAGASTNSAIWARGRGRPLGDALRACQQASGGLRQRAVGGRGHQ